MAEILTREDAFLSLTAAGKTFEIKQGEVLGDKMSVFAGLENSLRDVFEDSLKYGDKEYLIQGSRRITFNQHHGLARSFAQELVAEGVEPGDRVIFFALNTPDLLVAFWAVTSIGAIYVAGNSMAAGAELQHQIDLTDPKLIFSDKTLEARLADCDLGGRKLRNLQQAVAEAAENHPDAPESAVAISTDDPAVIIFTSGTTGRAKGATHSHRNVLTAIWFFRLNDAISTELGMPPSSDRKFLLATPMFHISALHNLSVTRLATGDTVVLTEGKFDGAKVLKLIESEKITSYGAVPTMIARILAEDLTQYDLSSLKILTVNSAPSSSDLKEQVREKLPHLKDTFGTSYGLTECSSAATIGTPAMLKADPESVGKAIATMDIEVRDAEGNPLPDGEEGEVYLRGPLIMLGYWNMGERGGVEEGGWFATGDLGTLQNGELFMRTRRSDLILRGGQNVYPLEIEHAIERFDGVKEAVAFGVEDSDLGQRVCAIVVAEDPQSFNVDELNAYLATQLARYKMPAAIKVTDEALPRNATGKVVRKHLDVSFTGSKLA